VEEETGEVDKVVAAEETGAVVKEVAAEVEREVAAPRCTRL
jgi:hypothetical protein